MERGSTREMTHRISTSRRVERLSIRKRRALGYSSSPEPARQVVQGNRIVGALNAHHGDLSTSHCGQVGVGDAVGGEKQRLRI